MKTGRLSLTALAALIAVGAVACAKNEEAQAGWTCDSTEVPMGESVRCTQSALLIDSSIALDESCTGATDNPELCTSYTCTAGEANCPPATTTSGGDTTTSAGGAGDGSSPTGSGSDSTAGASVGTDGSTTGTSTTASGDQAPGNGNGNGNGGSKSNGNGNGSGGTKSNAGGNGKGPFSSDFGGKDQCGYVESLPFCGSGGPTGSAPSSSAPGASGNPGGSTSGACVPSGNGSATSSEGGSTSQSPAVAATGVLCADHPFGSPESECGHFGLAPSGKDDNVGGLSCSATQSATVAIVKSGTKGCDKGQAAYRVYTGVNKGDTLDTPAGQGISHVTYCAGTPAAPAPSSTGSSGAAAPAPAPAPVECTSTTVKTQYKCKQDKKGNRSCESIPTCAPGSHPSKCGACVEDGSSDDCVAPSEGGCWVTGGGFIVGPNLATGAAADGHDNFGGNAKPMKDGRIQGHWNHVDHGTGNHAKGKPEYIVCRHVDEPGPGQPGGKKGFTMNQVYFGGHAEWRVAADGTWESGYWFDVVAKDHGEPGSVPHVKNGFMPDTYHFTIRKMDDPAGKVSGAIVYETKGVLEGGNIQLHPPNGGHPYTPMTLPSFVAFEP